MGPQEHMGRGRHGEARVHVEIKGHGEDVVRQEDMGFRGTQGTGGHGEDLACWEDLGCQEDLAHKENKGKQKLGG